MSPPDSANEVATEVNAAPGGSDHEVVDEKARARAEDIDAGSGKEGGLETTISPAPLPQYDSQEKGSDDEGAIIITGADAAAHLLPMRDDGEPALTFRSLFLATVLSAFQAVVSQIYTVSSKHASPCNGIFLFSSIVDILFAIVQTDSSHDSRNLYRSHCLLCR